MDNTIKKGFVYCLVCYNSLDTYKIGITTRPIQQRLKEINQNPGSCVKLKYLSPLTEDYRKIKKRIHTFFKASQTFTGENPSLTEWLYLPEDKLKLLQNILLYEFGSTFTNL